MRASTRRNRDPRTSRTSAVLAAVALVGSALAIVATPGPAVAETVPTPAQLGGGEPVVATVGDLQLAYFPCPSDPSKRDQYQEYTVPPGTTSVYVEAVGGQGESPDRNETGWGGLGAQTTGSVPVQAGDKLRVGAGCAGSSDGGTSPYASGGARGLGQDRTTYLIRSYGIDSGGGGGASAVLAADGTPLVVAGGGGGAAGGAVACYGIGDVQGNEYMVCIPPVLVPGANGGNGGDPAGAGAVGGGNPFPAAAGGCAASGAGGKGHDFDELGAGGAGGGGGGGFRGGCAGDAAPQTPGIPFFGAAVTGIAGNGGGAGSSHVDPKVISPGFTAGDNAGDGYVLILSGADSARTFDFGFTRDVKSQCIPAIDRVFVDVEGGAGGDSSQGGGPSNNSQAGSGGGAGRVQTVVQVHSGTQALVMVGEYGRGNGGWGNGSFDGGEGHGDAGSGGAASVVQFTETRCGERQPGFDEHAAHMIVAGGGGGGGEGGQDSTDGGDGGHGGSPPGNGQSGGGDVDFGDGGRGGGNDSNRGGEGTTSSTGGDGGGGGGGLPGGAKGHGAPDGGCCAGGGGGGGASGFAGAVVPPVVHTVGAGGEQGGDGHVTLLVPFPARRDQVAVVSGSKQDALPGTPYAGPLVVEALDAFGLPIAGREITFTAPDGYVEFANGSTTSITATTGADGRASARIASLDPPVHTGEFQVTATAATGTDGAPLKAAKFSLFDRPLPTSLALSSSFPDDRSNPGEAVTFTAKVSTAPLDPYDPQSDQPSRFGVPTGPVQFSVDGTAVTTVPLGADGTAKFSVPGLSAGQHTIGGSYQGDGRVFGPSASNLVQASGLDLVSLDLTSSDPSVPIGTTVRFTAVVQPRSATTDDPTGVVQFSVDGIERGDPVPMGTDGSAVSPDVSDLAAGQHTVGAYYLGDTNFLEAFRTMSQTITAGSAPAPARPDARLVAADGTEVGDGVYNPDGAGQTHARTIGTTADTYQLIVENDGTTPLVTRAHLPAPASGFEVEYRLRHADGSVVALEPGQVHELLELQPAETATIEMLVWAKHESATTFDAPLRIEAVDDETAVDTVRLVVTQLPRAAPATPVPGVPRFTG